MKIYQLVALLILANHGHASAKVEFPNKKGGLWSPDYQFYVYNIDQKNEDIPHQLFMKKKDEKEPKKILSYERHVSVTWSADSKYIFINNYTSSNYSTCIVFEVKNERQVDVASLIKTYDIGNAELWKNSHKFTECKQWMKSKVAVSFSGYGEFNSKGFDMEYLVDAKNMSILAKK